MTQIRSRSSTFLLALLVGLPLCGCVAGHKYEDKSMDFGAVKTVAVFPFVNLSKDGLGADRTREVFANLLLASGSVYVLPHGEVLRGTTRAGVTAPTTPSRDDIVKAGSALNADAIITGVVKEYGEVRSGQSTGNVISLSVTMFETATGKIVWSASTTKGGIGPWERLLGGGGQPMNEVTEEAVRELLRKLFN